MRLIGVFALLACVAAAAEWGSYPTEDLCEHFWGNTLGHVYAKMTFVGYNYTTSPFTVSDSQIVVASRGYTYPDAADYHPDSDVNKMRIECTAKCASNQHGYVRPQEWSCVNQRRYAPLLEMRDYVIVCEDADGNPFVVTGGQVWLPGSCFIKVKIFDHTPKPYSKILNPLRLTTIEKDRAHAAALHSDCEF